MKQFKKRVLLALCMVACLFALTACGKAEESSGMDPLEVEELQIQTQGLLESIAAVPDEQMGLLIEQNRENGMEAFAAGLENYVSLQDDLGAYVSSSQGETKETDDGYEVTVNAVFEKRACEFSITLDSKMTTITSLSFNPVYSVGENMTKAALNTLMGMGTVFLVLIFISLLISCFKYISVFEAKMKNKGEAAAAAAPAPQAAAPVPAETAEVNLADDLELVAVITAAIAASTGASSDGLVVRSIRRAPANKWKKA